MEKLALPLNIFGSILGSLGACFYALRIWQKHERANPATWAIVLFLDIVGLYLTYATGNHEPYIQVGWCIAATLIFGAAWARKGDWLWTDNETYTLVICILSVFVWLMNEAVLISIIGYLVAAYLSAWPQARDYRRNPEVARKSAWMWQVSAIAISCSLVAKLLEQKYGPEHTLIYIALIVLNLIMLTLCKRRVSVMT